MAVQRSGSRVFLFAAGYFGCYVPYSAITKALSSPSIHGRSVEGLALLPIMTLASLLSMVATISLLGWWRYARPSGARWPRPTRWTFLSGLATATILVTTTLAYTFDGVSLTFVMLVMRGGVLVIAPIIDAVTGRRIRWFSWIALSLSIASLASAFATRDGVVPLLCAIDLALYLAGYVVRLRLMAKLGKSDDPHVRRRYFVEEQMIATPVAAGLIALLAACGPAAVHEPLRAGFAMPWSDATTAAWTAVAGVCSQGTGVFGGLLLLDASETSYCVPLNRASSILGGVAASALLATMFAVAPPSAWELLGAGTLVAAIGALWVGPRLRSAPLGRAPAPRAPIAENAKISRARPGAAQPLRPGVDSAIPK